MRSIPLALFGISWSITDSIVLAGYLLVLTTAALHRFRGLNLSKVELYVVSIAVWRSVTALVGGTLSLSLTMKNLKFLFDVSPILLFRNPELLRGAGVMILAFVFSLSSITLVSFVELFGIANMDFFKGGMLEAFHRNHIKSGFAWSLGSLVVLVLAIKKDRRFLVLFPLLLVGLFYTQARSYYLGFVGATAGVFLLMALKHSVRYIVLGSALLFSILAGGYFITPVKDRFLSIFTDLQSDMSIKCRLIFLEEGLKALWENPFFGIGFGKWREYFAKLREIHAYNCPDYHVHNIFVHEAVETGLPGAILLSFLFGYLLFRLFLSYLRAPTGGDAESYLLIGIAALLNFIIGGMFEPSLVKSVVLLPTFTLVGLALGVIYSHDQVRDGRVARRNR